MNIMGTFSHKIPKIETNMGIISHNIFKVENDSGIFSQKNPNIENNMGIMLFPMLRITWENFPMYSQC